jgi:hypothetical protein
MITLMIEGASPSETLVNFYQTTRHSRSENSHKVELNKLKLYLYKKFYALAEL